MQNILDDEGHNVERAAEQVEDTQTDEGFFRRQRFIGNGDEGGEADDAHQSRGRVVHEVHDGGTVIRPSQVTHF